MTTTHDLFISARDAEALADLLMQARLLPDEALPADRAAMNSVVTYAEEPSGVRRTVTLAYPENVDLAQGKISVLSPVGRALLGHRRGTIVEALLPGAKLLRMRIVEVRQDREPLQAAA